MMTPLAGRAARGVAAGFVGTCAMTAGLWLQRKLRRNSDALIDYDASDHVVVAAAKVMSKVIGWAPQSPPQRHAVFLLVHWGYGSVVGIGGQLTGQLFDSRRTATAAFYIGCQTMALTMFPTLGDTPVPWRWPLRVLASSFGQHALYAIAVTATLSKLEPADSRPDHCAAIGCPAAAW